MGKTQEPRGYGTTVTEPADGRAGMQTRTSSSRAHKTTLTYCLTLSHLVREAHGLTTPDRLRGISHQRLACGYALLSSACRESRTSPSIQETRGGHSGGGWTGTSKQALHPQLPPASQSGLLLTSSHLILAPPPCPALHHTWELPCPRCSHCPPASSSLWSSLFTRTVSRDLTGS